MKSQKMFTIKSGVLSSFVVFPNDKYYQIYSFDTWITPKNEDTLGFFCYKDLITLPKPEVVPRHILLEVDIDDTHFPSKISSEVLRLKSFYNGDSYWIETKYLSHIICAYKLYIDSLCKFNINQLQLYKEHGVKINV